MQVASFDLSDVSLTSREDAILDGLFSISRTKILVSRYFRHYFFSDTLLPLMGWKIHVSSTYSDYKKVQEIVSNYCKQNRVNFKVLLNKKIVFHCYLKTQSRFFNGKLVTIYPQDPKHARQILKDLYPLLLTFNGPYVFTDKRFKNSVLFYRFGDFVSPDFLDYDPKFIDGKLLLKHKPDNVPDLFSASKNVNSKSSSIKIGGVLFKAPLFYSNYGGVYVGEYNSKTVVVKEALPYSGTNLFNDPIKRKQHEIFISKRINNSPFFPKFISSFKSSKHFFSIFEYKEGLNLLQSKIFFSFKYHWNIFKLDSIEQNFNSLIRQFILLLEDAKQNKLVLNDVRAQNFLWDFDQKLFFVDLDFSFFLGENPIKVFQFGEKINLKPGILQDIKQVGLLLSDLIFDTNLLLNKFSPVSLVKDFFIYAAHFYSLPTSLINKVLFFLTFSRSRKLSSFENLHKNLNWQKHLVSFASPPINRHYIIGLDLYEEVFCNNVKRTGSQWKTFKKIYMHLKSCKQTEAESSIDFFINKHVTVLDSFYVMKVHNKVNFFLNNGCAQFILLLLLHKKLFSSNKYFLLLTNFLKTISGIIFLNSSFWEDISGLIYTNLEAWKILKENQYLIAAQQQAKVLIHFLYNKKYKQFFTSSKFFLDSSDYQFVEKILLCFDNKLLRTLQ